MTLLGIEVKDILAGGGLVLAAVCFWRAWKTETLK